jgi:hypothetical protein
MPSLASRGTVFSFRSVRTVKAIARPRAPENSPPEFGINEPRDILMLSSPDARLADRTHPGGKAVRIALIALPFIQIPPKFYGGTELFIANLAEGLKDLGHEVVVYADGESHMPVEVRWLYPEGQWPIRASGRLRTSFPTI